MKKILIILLVLSIAVTAYAVFMGAGVRYVRPMHPQINNVGIVGHWKLWCGLMSTGLVFDYGPFMIVGTLVDTEAPAAPTLIPTYPGFYFDGDNDHIEIADNVIFSPGDGVSGTPFSVSAWINMVNATEFIIATKGVYNTDGEWRFATETNDYLYAIFFDETEDDCYIGRVYQTALPADEWFHVVMTYDGDNISAGVNLYLDSVNVDNANQENNPLNFVAVENDLGHAVWMGRDWATYGNGTIDDLMIFNKELTNIEIRNIYEVTRWRYSK